MEAVLIAKDIKKTYLNHLREREVIFKELNLKAYKEELTLIMGKSGTGKTTLLNILAGIDMPDEGEVKVLGFTLTKLNEKKRAEIRAKHIGFVFQSFALIPEFSILENCIIPLLLQGYSRKDAEDKAKELLSKYLPKIDFRKYPRELSGGEQQRVALVRAIIHEPTIILADEPTGNLDETNAKIIKETLKELAKNGKCVIVVTHDEDYKNYANRLYEFGINRDRKSSLMPKSFLTEKLLRDL